MNTSRTDQAILACGLQAVPSSFEEFARNLEIEHNIFRDEAMRQFKNRLLLEEIIEVLRKQIKLLESDPIKWTLHHVPPRKNGKNGLGCG